MKIRPMTRTGKGDTELHVELQSLKECLIRSEGYGIIVQHWPTRRTVLVSNKQVREHNYERHPDESILKSDCKKRCWRFKSSV